MDREILSLAERVVKLAPPGGLGFHGTSEARRNSIRKTGLNYSLFDRPPENILFSLPQNCIYYNYFAPEEGPEALIETLKSTAYIAVERASNSLYGPFSEPLLVSFVINQKSTFKPDDHPARTVPSVPKSDLLSLLTILREEYKSEDMDLISDGFISRALRSLSKKLSSQKYK